MKRNKYVLPSKQITRRGHTCVTYWDNGWRMGYLTAIGRKWAKGRKAACGSPLKLSLTSKGSQWKEFQL